MTAPQETIGRCHLCQMRTEIAYCPVCDHWFCAACRIRWFDRGVAFIKELTGGKQPGCCGPREESHAAA